VNVDVVQVNHRTKVSVPGFRLNRVVPQVMATRDTPTALPKTREVTPV
jgi:hypothetical protein